MMVWALLAAVALGQQTIKGTQKKYDIDYGELERLIEQARREGR